MILYSIKNVSHPIRYKHPRNYVILGEVSLFSFAANANTLIVFPRTISFSAMVAFILARPPAS